MKKNTKHFILLYFIIVILIGFIFFSNKGLIVTNHSITLKNMSESTQITNLNKTIDNLNASHTEFSNQIQSSKQKIANAINMYPNNNATENNSLDELSTMINNLTNIPEDTYYYEEGTEGDSTTIKRYKKIGDSYYVCDANGIVLEGGTATDISSITLIPYNASVAENMSAGSAGYASGSLYLGDGSDNVSYNEGVGAITIKTGTGNGTYSVINLVSDYSKLTTANFVFIPTKISASATGKGSHNGNHDGSVSVTSSTNISPTLSYDASTGNIKLSGCNGTMSEKKAYEADGQLSATASGSVSVVGNILCYE